ncbi:MAG: GGDEF domain-containing protein [Deltaproteobacteria bacterium]|jgi:diguanylate cyclase (GGDEF)-like protein|nr:GGDEF domain-containing protein [Deltaproteobacteria bacterium]
MHIEDGLDKLLLGRYEEALAAFERCQDLPQARKLSQITRMLLELSVYGAELSKGNLAIKMPSPDNHSAIGLKNLHAKLRRLDRQLLMAASGYAAPPIDYMGDLSEGLDTMIRQAYLRAHQIEHDYDSETGILNRRAFMRGIYDIIQARPSKVGVLFCCELDNIKYINATHGYEAGDLYISKVVEVLRSCESGTSLLARTGGNEFAVYAHGFDNEEEAQAAVQGHLKTLLNTRVALEHEVVKIRVSCGVAVYPSDATASDLLMNYASLAMFEVKNLDRGTSMRFSPEVYRTKARLLSQQERLDELIEGQLIHFAFQPVVDLRNFCVVGYEALMRPKTNNFSSPLDILSLAESQSKLHQLERLTFEVIFEWISHNSKHLSGRKIFFNTISAQYLNSVELGKIHPQYKSISKHMVFEILEMAAMESLLPQQINALRRELAVLVAIDDFGCGHSNAIRLMSISPDILKLDRFFINNIQNAPVAKREFLSNILAYCRAKGIKTLAEGVETREEAASIIKLGFDYAQGYYFGYPEFMLADISPQAKEDAAALLALRPRNSGRA